jgi:hypothetical protein
MIMEQYIPKSALVAEFNRLIAELVEKWEGTMFEQGRISAFEDAKLFLDTLEVKEVDIDKLCEFRKNIGFAYPEGASEYQKQLACYRQGIKDVIKAQKGE